MSEVLTTVHELTPARLAAILRRNNLLADGEIVAVDITASKQTNVSSVYHLQVRYSPAEIDTPALLFLKLLAPGQVWADKEIQFYRDLVPIMAQEAPDHQWPFPHCFDVAYDPATGHSHLLLEDLSETHFTNQEKMPTSLRLCEQVVDAYARFHAFWWEHPKLGNGIGECLTDRMLDDFIRQAQLKFEQMMGDAPALFTQTQLAILPLAVAGWPLRRRQRVMQGRGVTLVHRDPHPLNFLYPHDPSLGAVKLIDWQSWRIDTGTDDLAYCMACHWPAAQLAPIEQSLLRRYYDGLTTCGVGNYDRADCWYDYQASIIRCLFFLMVAWSPAQLVQGAWAKRMHAALVAYERCHCAEVWSSA
jgi:hypothetical protein